MVEMEPVFMKEGNAHMPNGNWNGESFSGLNGRGAYLIVSPH